MSLVSKTFRAEIGAAYLTRTLRAVMPSCVRGAGNLSPVWAMAWGEELGSGVGDGLVGPHVGEHPDPVGLERGGHPFVPGEFLGQDVGTDHGQAGALPRQRGGAVAGVAEQGDAPRGPVLHADL